MQGYTSSTPAPPDKYMKKCLSSYSKVNSKPNKRHLDWLHLESVCSQRVVSPSPVKMKTHMGALVCDNTFGTDVEELFLNIKAKTLFYYASVQFVFYEKHIYYTTKNKLICCISPITGFTCDQSYMHSKRKKKKQKVSRTHLNIFSTL